VYETGKTKDKDEQELFRFNKRSHSGWLINTRWENLSTFNAKSFSSVPGSQLKNLNHNLINWWNCNPTQLIIVK
jgi:hypothetical protein